MELEKLAHTGEEAGGFLDTIHTLADGDRFMDEPTAFTREVGISHRTLAAASRELGTAKLIVGIFRGGRKKYSTFAPPQPTQPIYPLRGLRGSQSG